MSKDSLKVLSFNLRLDTDDNPQTWRERKELAFKLIDELEPDLIGVQEALSSMLADIKSKYADTYHIYAEFRSDKESKEAPAVLAKKERFDKLSASWFMNATNPQERGLVSWDADLPRITNFMVLQDKADGVPFVFMNTHLDHAGTIARFESSNLISNYIRDYKEQGLDVILTGDFNAYPNAPELEPLFKDPSLSNSYTLLKKKYQDNTLSIHNFTGETKGLPIDHIFVTDRFKIEDATIVRNKYDGNFPSDHYPILAKLTK